MAVNTDSSSFRSYWMEALPDYYALLDYRSCFSYFRSINTAIKMKFKELRKKYPVFSYDKYAWKVERKDFIASFWFSTGNIKFNPKITIKNIPFKTFKNIDNRYLNNLVFNLGMIEMFSYWKSVCSKDIMVKAGYLNKDQIEWWKDILIKGMGQYFYENGIDFTGNNFVKIISTGKDDFVKGGDIKGDRVLIPIGGGKDSAVTLEIMKKFKKDTSCFSLNPKKNTLDMFRISGYKELIVCERTIEEKLLRMNRKGFLNGHTPFVAYLSFLTVIVSALFNKKHIVMSNEDSSNEGNVDYCKTNINHQYSKSLDFENKFRKYCNKYLSKQIDYFSVLRPMYEIQIGRIFASLDKYFPVFISCNEAYKTYSGTRKPGEKWCGHCSKCLFVFMILYPFIKEKKLLSIFKDNLFEKDGLLPTMLELIGEREVKPFECVGTRKESLVALYLSLQKAKQTNRIPLLLQYFEIEIIPKYKNWEKMVKEVMEHWNDNNNIPWED